VLRIIRQLKQVRVELGQPFQMLCVVEAQPRPTDIAWFKDGLEIDSARCL